MRPGQLTPNEFESAILHRMVRQFPALSPCLGDLHVVRREFTGAGSFTHFQHNSSAVKAPDGPITLDGHIDMPDIPNGMGAVLFIKEGGIILLEIVTYGAEHWDGTFGHMVNTSSQQMLLLSLQRSLLGAVHPTLRQASIEADPTLQTVRIRFEYDGAPHAAVRESCSMAATEVIADFPAPWQLHEQHIAVPVPQKLSSLAFVAYLRAEG